METAEVVMVSFIAINGQQDDDGQITASGTATMWHAEDLQMARTLREQLCGLFGDPVAETLLPTATAEVLRNLEEPWPGAVRFDRDDA